MSVNSFGYSKMQSNLYDTFPFDEVQQSKELLKQYTATYIPRTTENNRFVYTGTEINPIKHQTPFLQRSLIEGFKMPIFEYYGRVENIPPRPDYIEMNPKFNYYGKVENTQTNQNYLMFVDMTSNEMKLFKKEFG
jgi:hypothetical protein